MAPAVYDTVSAEIKAGDYVFKASGSTLKFSGFMAVYTEGADEETEREEGLLPELTEGQTLVLLQIKPEQHFTQPPPRYTEAMLVKALEERGIGRPSTYAPIIDTIQKRGYVKKEKGRFKPTELGQIVTEILKEYFSDIVDLDFTAEMESQLDKIESGEENWRQIVESFYGPFKEKLRVAEEKIEEVKIEDEVTNEKCEICGRNMVIKRGKYGEFMACSGFPECRNTKPLIEQLGVKCPKCGGDIVIRKSKKGRKFYGCSNYPECDFVSWDPPVESPCPRCGGLMVEKTARNKKIAVCTNPECGYKKLEG
jgi:DNA topoisomerase-1